MPLKLFVKSTVREPSGMEDSGFDSDSKSNVIETSSRSSSDMGSKVICEQQDDLGDESVDSRETDPLGVHGRQDFPGIRNHARKFLFQEKVVYDSGAQGVASGSSGVDASDESPTIPHSKPKVSTLQLQKKLEKHIHQAKKDRQSRNSAADSQPKKSLIPRNRLPVPNKGQSIGIVTKADEQPLVTWESDSDDDYEFQTGSKVTAREITQQLIKDGYNLDLTPDDEDLDLIPPKPLNQHCTCCSWTYSCVLQ